MYARMACEPLDAVEREVRALELRIGVDHDGDVDRLCNRAEIGFDLRIGKREIRLQDRQNAVGPARLIRFRLRHGVQCRGRGDAGHHRHAAAGRFDGGLDDRHPLGAAQIRKLAGRAERRQAVHPGSNEILAQPRQHVAADGAVGIERRNEIGEDAMEIRHGVMLQKSQLR